MADLDPPELTKRLRQYDPEALLARGFPRIFNNDLRAAADLLEAQAAELAALRTQRDEHDNVVIWADGALARRDRTIADLLAQRDAAVAQRDALLDAIGDPDELRRAAVSVARDRKVTSAEAERRILALTRIAGVKARIAAAVEAANPQEDQT